METPDSPIGGDFPPGTADLSEAFAAFAANAEARAPLYLVLGRLIAEDAELYGLLDAASPPQRRPVMLLAALHHAVLAQPEAPLAAWYRTISGDAALDATEHDPGEALRQFCCDHRAELIADIATRSVQTNEVGRCAPILLALSHIERDCGLPLGLIDLGTSAGLTLCLDHYQFLFEPGGLVRSAQASVRSVDIVCGTRGEPPIPKQMPMIGTRLGIDTEPAIGDDARRWLQACVWADEIDRFQRLDAAYEIAAPVARTIIEGDYVDSLADVMQMVPDGVHPVVITSWTLCYLDVARQTAFRSMLDRLAQQRDLSWVVFESPREVPTLGLDDDALTWLATISYRQGQPRTEVLARAHPHGHWLHWLHSAG